MTSTKEAADNLKLKKRAEVLKTLQDQVEQYKTALDMIEDVQKELSEINKNSNDIKINWTNAKKKYEKDLHGLNNLIKDIVIGFENIKNDQSTIEHNINKAIKENKKNFKEYNQQYLIKVKKYFEKSVKHLSESNPFENTVNELYDRMRKYHQYNMVMFISVIIVIILINLSKIKYLLRSFDIF